MTPPPSDTIRALIVDDEPLARRTIRHLLNNDPEITVVGECSNGFDAVDALRAERPDLLFLDVQMPEMNGFEVLEAVGPDAVEAVIFVTAYDRYALKAFDARALDYLLKPFEDERFERAVERAKRRVRQSRPHDFNRNLEDLLAEYRSGSAGESPGKPSGLQRLSVKTGGRIHFLKVSEIEWIEAADQYVVLHAGGKSHLLRASLNRLETQLDPDRFFRPHRSALVNLDFVKELEPHDSGDGTIVLSSGTRLKLSRTRREKFELALTRLP